MIRRLFCRKRSVICEENTARDVPLMVLDTSGEVSQDTWTISGQGSARERLLMNDGTLYALAWQHQNGDRFTKLIAKTAWDDLRHSPDIERAARNQGLLDRPDMIESTALRVCRSCRHG